MVTYVRGVVCGSLYDACWFCVFGFGYCYNACGSSQCGWIVLYLFVVKLFMIVCVFEDLCLIRGVFTCFGGFVSLCGILRVVCFYGCLVMSFLLTGCCYF